MQIKEFNIFYNTIHKYGLKQTCMKILCYYRHSYFQIQCPNKLKSSRPCLHNKMDGLHQNIFLVFQVSTASQFFLFTRKSISISDVVWRPYIIFSNVIVELLSNKIGLVSTKNVYCESYCSIYHSHDMYWYMYIGIILA